MLVVSFFTCRLKRRQRMRKEQEVERTRRFLFDNGMLVQGRGLQSTVHGGSGHEEERHRKKDMDRDVERDMVCLSPTTPPPTYASSSAFCSEPASVSYPYLDAKGRRDVPPPPRARLNQ